MWSTHPEAGPQGEAPVGSRGTSGRRGIKVNVQASQSSTPGTSDSNNLDTLMSPE